MLETSRPSWRDPRILTTLVMVFISGALVGAVTMRVGYQYRQHRAAAPYWTDDKAFFSYQRLQKELNLSPEQSDRLKTILDDFVKYHDDLEAQIEDVRATGRNRILQMLTPEQRQRFEKLSTQLPNQ